MRGRPELYTAYEQDQALLNTPPKRAGVAGLLVFAVVLPLFLSDDVTILLAVGFAAAIGAIGLNLVTGYAGQVSLGHAFFIGVGAYTAAVLGTDGGRGVIGFDLPLLVWLPAAGLVAALFGLLVGPIATRLRGLYLAIVTLGLVFLGEHIFKEARPLTGGVGVGRRAARAELYGFSFHDTSELLGITLTRHTKLYLLMLAMLVVFAIVGRNIARSAVGRAFSAVRDRDVAAAVMGVRLAKHKVLAFTISSFYAGVAGALLYTIQGHIEPTSFNLLMSVRYIAMILIGGIATISGSIMGALFITLLPRMTQVLAGQIPLISAQASGGGVITVFQLEAILYGLLIVGFLIFEPRGLYGIWLRTRNYWKGWPFSY